MDWLITTLFACGVAIGLIIALVVVLIITTGDVDIHIVECPKIEELRALIADCD
jgi:hypothetical protein